MTIYNEKRTVRAPESRLIDTPAEKAENKFLYIGFIMDDYLKRNPSMSNAEWWDKLDSLCSKSLQELKIYYHVFK